MNVNAYLNFPGTCAEAVAFYKDCLGATAEVMTFRGTPMAEKMPSEALDRVMHATIKIGASTLMASDTMPGTPHEGMKGCAVSLNVDDLAQAERIFGALSHGGKVTMPFAAQFWGAKFGMLTDKFGVAWMVNCELPKS